MKNIFIRTFTKEDAPAVDRLIHQLTKNIVNPESLQQRLELMTTAPYIFCRVALEYDDVVGFAQLAWYSIPSKGRVGWIEEVVVNKNHRGHGIATMLVKDLLDFAEKMKFAQVQLAAQNPGAISLYKKLGFVEKGPTLFVKRYF